MVEPLADSPTQEVIVPLPRFDFDNDCSGRRPCHKVIIIGVLINNKVLI
jgi:hypothetical protein